MLLLDEGQSDEALAFLLERKDEFDRLLKDTTKEANSLIYRQTLTCLL